MNRLPRRTPVEPNTRKGFPTWRDMSGRETKDVRASEAVAVRVICTDEEWMIANTVCRVLGLIIEKGNDHEDKEGV